MAHGGNHEIMANNKDIPILKKKKKKVTRPEKHVLKKQSEHPNQTAVTESKHYQIESVK